MIGPKVIAALCAAALALAATAGWKGYQMGFAAAEAAQNARLLAQIEASEKLDADRREIARERDQLARKLEDEAHADPVVVDRCLSPDRVRRLNSLR